MLASPANFGEVPLRSDRLIYEPKYDGIRALVAIEPPVPFDSAQGRPSPESPVPRVIILSRNGLDKTAQFPDLALAFAALAAKRRGALLVDGEIVALDARGRPVSFTRLQPRIHASGTKAVADAMAAQPVAFVAFDLLRDGGEDLRRLPLTARRLRLQRAFRPPARSPLRLSEIVVTDAHALVRRAVREGWEGLVVKDASSTYETGRRSPAWRKLKLVERQEFIVGGWTEGRQARSHFGALLLGVWPTAQGPRPMDLTYVGSVGSGFDDAELARVAALLKPLETSICPFGAMPEASERGAARGAPARLEKAHWVKPELVVEVKYTEFTPDGRLRHPVYLGLRDDKNPATVGLERTRNEHGTNTERTRKLRTRGSRLRQGSGGLAEARRAEAAGLGTGAPRGNSKLETRNSKLSLVLDHLRALEDARKDGWLDLPDGHRLHVTNLWKVFWPELKITKGDLLRYYAEVSPLILPAVADRPLVMKRFPNGIHGKAFYQQRALERPPAGVRVETLPEGVDPIRDEEEARNPRRFVGGSLTTLLCMAQMAVISQDPWFSTMAAPREADQVAIDLDPGEGATWGTVLDVARWVHDELERLRVPAVPKTSGSRGLHIYIPLPRGTSYETGQLLCQIVATMVSSKHPRQATVERMVSKRPKGTVYIDYLQNILGKTLATAYSARASDFAGVSTPLTWREVDAGIDAREFTLRTAPARFREAGDLWARLRRGRPADLHVALQRIGSGR